MFIETLEFTIPIDLCSLFTTLQKGPRSNLEFPASVNSYGTTQDASIQVLVRANKLTFKVEGVSSDSSIISKSECRTLKLSVFDVDRSLIPEESDYNGERVSIPSKRTHDSSTPIPAKSSRTSFSDYANSPSHIPQQHISTSHRAKSKSQSNAPIDVKEEPEDPEDPDLIEIEPDPEDLVPKTEETPYMQIDYSSTGPCTQTSQAALDRLSFPHSSQQSSSFQQNVPHVPDYAEPGPSRNRGSQGADDFLVYQDDNDRDDYGDNDNSADYSNEGVLGFRGSGVRVPLPRTSSFAIPIIYSDARPRAVPCPDCDKKFCDKSSMIYHKQAIHDRITFTCACGRVYNHRRSMQFHHKSCPVHLAQNIVESEFLS